MAEFLNWKSVWDSFAPGSYGALVNLCRGFGGMLISLGFRLAPGSARILSLERLPHVTVLLVLPPAPQLNNSTVTVKPRLSTPRPLKGDSTTGSKEFRPGF